MQNNQFAVGGEHLNRSAGGAVERDFRRADFKRDIVAALDGFGELALGDLERVARIEAEDDVLAVAVADAINFGAEGRADDGVLALAGVDGHIRAAVRDAVRLRRAAEQRIVGGVVDIRHNFISPKIYCSTAGCSTGCSTGSTFSTGAAGSRGRRVIRAIRFFSSSISACACLYFSSADFIVALLLSSIHLA